MIKRYYADRDQTPVLTDGHIRQIAANLAATLIAESDITVKDRINVSIQVHKIRNRSKDAQYIEYVITGSLIRL